MALDVFNHKCIQRLLSQMVPPSLLGPRVKPRPSFLVQRSPPAPPGASCNLSEAACRALPGSPRFLYTNRSGGRGCGRRRETPRHARQHPPDPPAAPPGIAPCRTTPTGGSIGSPAEPARQAGGLCGAEADGADASGTNLPRNPHRACGIGLGRPRGRLRLRPGLRFPAQPTSVKAIGRAMSSCGSPPR